MDLLVFSHLTRLKILQYNNSSSSVVGQVTFFQIVQHWLLLTQDRSALLHYTSCFLARFFKYGPFQAFFWIFFIFIGTLLDTAGKLYNCK